MADQGSCKPNISPNVFSLVSNSVKIKNYIKWCQGGFSLCKLNIYYYHRDIYKIIMYELLGKDLVWLKCSQKLLHKECFYILFIEFYIWFLE